MQLCANSVWCALVLTGLSACSERVPNGPVDAQSLTLKPVLLGEGPFAFSYTIPFNIDVSSNRWGLTLRDNGKPAGFYEITRQTNGTYLVEWGALFATRGPHELQVALYRPHKRTVLGPSRLENVTNLVSFDPLQTSFRSQVRIRGSVAVPAAQYRIDFFDASNAPLATIVGHTENGMIDEVWPCTTSAGTVRNDRRFRADLINPKPSTPSWFPNRSATLSPQLCAHRSGPQSPALIQ